MGLSIPVVHIRRLLRWVKDEDGEIGLAFLEIVAAIKVQDRIVWRWCAWKFRDAGSFQGEEWYERLRDGIVGDDSDETVPASAAPARACGYRREA